MWFRKKPIKFEAVQWTGDNLREMRAFCGGRFDGDGYVLQIFNPHPTYLTYIGSSITAELWVEANRAHLPIETGEWVVKDELGFYPCKDDIMMKNNTPIEKRSDD